jgi:hypothetical protein
MKSLKRYLFHTTLYGIFSATFPLMLCGVGYKSPHWEYCGRLPFWNSYMTFLLPWSYLFGFVWLCYTLYLIAGKP